MPDGVIPTPSTAPNPYHQQCVPSLLFRYQANQERWLPYLKSLLFPPPTSLWIMAHNNSLLNRQNIIRMHHVCQWSWISFIVDQLSKQEEKWCEGTFGIYTWIENKTIICTVWRKDWIWSKTKGRRRRRVIIGMIQVDIPGLQKVLCWTTFNWLGVEDVEVLVVVFLTAVGVAK